ncbi:hypothetical protein Bca52824_045503 [Brassica carinata]|uniref:Uncharacterized protein n=1 Tax=Brassica carinata TaxID=52824 RepID=A0A8X7UPC7_BRACI|nr:hypothetical protein Bca52824_045503 [Brassica carinata]
MELLHFFCRIQVKVGGKPVIVRVKRLEINERSFKLPLLNLSKLPLSGSESDVNENSCSKGKFEEPKVAFKKEGTALDQRLQKATDRCIECSA